MPNLLRRAPKPLTTNHTLFISVFTNDMGEPMACRYEDGADGVDLWHSDVDEGWRRVPPHKSHGWVFDADEQAWLKVCLHTVETIIRLRTPAG